MSLKEWTSLDEVRAWERAAEMRERFAKLEAHNSLLEKVLENAEKLLASPYKVHDRDYGTTCNYGCVTCDLENAINKLRCDSQNAKIDTDKLASTPGVIEYVGSPEILIPNKLEKAWREQTPSCLTCGWSPEFYEVELEETGKPGEYHADCVSKDAADAWSHRGHYLYIK